LNKVLFPFGVIKRVDQIIDSLNLRVIVKNATLRRNIAYTFQFISVVDWLLDKTTIDLVAREQAIKYGIVALNSIVEGIVYDHLKERLLIDPSKKLEKNIEKLEQKVYVPKKVTSSLKKIHRKRGKIHLQLWGTELEHQKYKTEDYKEAKNALSELMNWIHKALSEDA